MNNCYLFQLLSINSKQFGNNVHYFLITVSKDCIVIVVISRGVNLEIEVRSRYIISDVWNQQIMKF